MKKISLLIMTMTLMACTSQPIIKRTHYEDYEQLIGFTQVIQHGDRLYLSGITAPGPDMKLAVEAVYGSIRRILEKHGATMGDVVKENLYTTDMSAMKTQVATRRQFYPKGRYPAATWVEVKGLYMPEYVLEVEVEVVLTASE